MIIWLIKQIAMDGVSFSKKRFLKREKGGILYAAAAWEVRTMNVIEVSNVTKKYNETVVVHSVSFAVKKGEIYDLFSLDRKSVV